jgi:hypothetical protein
MAPYLLDVILANEINPIKHKASIKDTKEAASGSEKTLVIELFKQNSILAWSSLEYSSQQAVDDEDHTSRQRQLKQEQQQIKSEAHTQQSQLEQSLSQQRTDKRIENERFALRKQMALDESERTHLETLKQAEKSEAEAEVYEALSKYGDISKKESEKSTSQTKKSVTFGGPSSSSSVSASASQPRAQQPPQPQPSTEIVTGNKNIFSDSDIDAMLAQCDIDDEQPRRDYDRDSREEDEVDDTDAVKYVPAPRTQGSLSRIGYKFP